VQEGSTGAVQDLDEAEALLGFEPLHDRVQAGPRDGLLLCKIGSGPWYSVVIGSPSP
jgi:hypothetical protein